MKKYVGLIQYNQLLVTSYRENFPESYKLLMIQIYSLITVAYYQRYVTLT